MQRSIARQLLVLNPLEQMAAGRSQDWIRRRVVNEGVGIEKNGIAGLQVGEDHCPSSRSNSGERASRRSSSGSPFQPRMPAVSWTQFVFSATVTETFSCSGNGNGSLSLS